MNRRIAALAFSMLAACGGSQPVNVHRAEPEEPPHTAERTYARPAGEVAEAAIAVMKSMEFPLDDDRHDKMGGIIVARRSNGSRVTIEVHSIDERNSRATVRVDPGNGNLAAVVQENLLKKLGLGAAKTSFLGTNSAEGRYACTLERGATAAEAVFRRLGFQLIRREIQTDKAVVDGRQSDSIPVRIQLTKVDAATSTAVFTVGSSRDSRSGPLAQRIRMEFERELASSAVEQ